eukprot:jgi/Bigna1/126997/aug1.3_g1705
MLNNASLRRSKAGTTLARPGVSEPVAKVEKYLNRRKALIALEERMIVKGVVCTKRDDGIGVRISTVFQNDDDKDGQGWKDKASLTGLTDDEFTDLNLVAICHNEEIMTKGGGSYHGGGGAAAATAAAEERAGSSDGRRSGQQHRDSKQQKQRQLMNNFTVGDDLVKGVIVSVDVHSVGMRLSL